MADVNTNPIKKKKKSDFWNQAELKAKIQSNQKPTVDKNVNAGDAFARAQAARANLHKARERPSAVASNPLEERQRVSALGKYARQTGKKFSHAVKKAATTAALAGALHTASPSFAVAQDKNIPLKSKNISTQVRSESSEKKSSQDATLENIKILSNLGRAKPYDIKTPTQAPHLKTLANYLNVPEISKVEVSFQPPAVKEKSSRPKFGKNKPQEIEILPERRYLPEAVDYTDGIFRQLINNGQAEIEMDKFFGGIYKQNWPQIKNMPSMRQILRDHPKVSIQAVDLPNDNVAAETDRHNNVIKYNARFLPIVKWGDKFIYDPIGLSNVGEPKFEKVYHADRNTNIIEANNILFHELGHICQFPMPQQEVREIKQGGQKIKIFNRDWMTLMKSAAGESVLGPVNVTGIKLPNIGGGLTQKEAEKATESRSSDAEKFAHWLDIVRLAAKYGKISPPALAATPAEGVADVLNWAKNNQDFLDDEQKKWLKLIKNNPALVRQLESWAPYVENVEPAEPDSLKSTPSMAVLAETPAVEEKAVFMSAPHLSQPAPAESAVFQKPLEIPEETEKFQEQKIMAPRLEVDKQHTTDNRRQDKEVAKIMSLSEEEIKNQLAGALRADQFENEKESGLHPPQIKKPLLESDKIVLPPPSAGARPMLTVGQEATKQQTGQMSSSQLLTGRVDSLSGKFDSLSSRARPVVNAGRSTTGVIPAQAGIHSNNLAQANQGEMQAQEQPDYGLGGRLMNKIQPGWQEKVGSQLSKATGGMVGGEDLEFAMDLAYDNLDRTLLGPLAVAGSTVTIIGPFLYLIFFLTCRLPHGFELGMDKQKLKMTAKWATIIATSGAGAGAAAGAEAGGASAAMKGAQTAGTMAEKGGLSSVGTSRSFTQELTAGEGQSTEQKIVDELKSRQQQDQNAQSADKGSDGGASGLVWGFFKRKYRWTVPEPIFGTILAFMIVIVEIGIIGSALYLLQAFSSIASSLASSVALSYDLSSFMGNLTLAFVKNIGYLQVLGQPLVDVLTQIAKGVIGL